MSIEVEDVVEPIIFLLSSKSQMINGIGLPIGKPPSDFVPLKLRMMLSFFFVWN